MLNYSDVFVFTFLICALAFVITGFVILIIMSNMQEDIKVSGVIAFFVTLIMFVVIMLNAKNLITFFNNPKINSHNHEMQNKITSKTLVKIEDGEHYISVYYPGEIEDEDLSATIYYTDGNKQKMETMIEKIKYTNDNSKDNSYSLKHIKDGYIIKYIYSESVKLD